MKLKKVLSLLIISLIAFSAFSAPLGGSTLVGTPAATVNLIRNHAITNEELDQRVSEYQASGANISREQVLDVMINDEVFLQGAERDGIEITDQMVDAAIAQQKTNIEQQLGQTLSDEDYRSLLESQTGLSYDAYRENIREQLLVNQYLVQQKGEQIQNDINNIQITDDSIETYYRRNRQTFYSPENVRISHIFIPYDANGDESVNNDHAALMVDVAEQIKNGQITFEQAVQDYSEDDSKNIGGDIGWLTMDNQTARNGLGDDFVDTVLSMRAGEISGMLESNMGYHIVRCQVHNDGKILELDDRINPEQNLTLREYLRQLLSQVEANNIMNNALNDLIGELRSQARIRTY